MTKGLPKALVSSVCSKAFGCSALNALGASTVQPLCDPTGDRALEDALGSCGSQRPICTEEDFQKYKKLLVLLKLTCRPCPWGGGGQISHCVGVEVAWWMLQGTL